MYGPTLARVADSWSRGFDKLDHQLNRQADDWTVNLVAAAHDKFGIERWDCYSERFVSQALRYIAQTSDDARHQVIWASFEGRTAEDWVKHALPYADEFAGSLGDIDDRELTDWLNLDMARMSIVDGMNERYGKPTTTRIGLLDAYREEAAGVFLVALEHIGLYIEAIRMQSSARKGA